MTERLRQAIEESGLTVSALAAQAKIPQPMLQRFVVGKRDLRMKTADKLAVYFNLELAPIDDATHKQRHAD